MLGINGFVCLRFRQEMLSRQLMLKPDSFTNGRCYAFIYVVATLFEIIDVTQLNLLLPARVLSRLNKINSKHASPCVCFFCLIVIQFRCNERLILSFATVQLMISTSL